MFKKIAILILAILVVPFFLRAYGLGVIGCGLILLMVVVIYWKLRHRIPESNSNDSLSTRTRKARRAINTGTMVSTVAQKNFQVTAKDMRKQKFHDELFW